MLCKVYTREVKTKGKIMENSASKLDFNNIKTFVYHLHNNIYLIQLFVK